MKARVLLSFVLLGAASALALQEPTRARADIPPPGDPHLLEIDLNWSGCYYSVDPVTQEGVYTFYARLNARGWKWKYYYYWASIYDENLGQWKWMVNPNPNIPAPVGSDTDQYLTPYFNRNYEGDLQSHSWTYTVSAFSTWGQMIEQCNWGGTVRGDLFYNEILDNARIVKTDTKIIVLDE